MDAGQLTPTRRLRLGVIGWGRIGPVHAIAVEGLAGRIEPGWPDRIYRVDGSEGARGVAFVEAAAASSAGAGFVPIDAAP